MKRGCLAQGSGQAVPEKVVKSTRAVLLSSVKGVSLKNFNRDYTNLLGERFPWRKLGYTSAKGLLVAMPEAVRFEYSDRDGDYRLHGIGTKDMFMPSWVKKAQGRVNRPPSTPQVGHALLQSPGSSCRINRPPSTPKVVHGFLQSPGSSCEINRQLVYNARGLVTLHITWHSLEESSEKFMKELNENRVSTLKQCLTGLLSIVAKPVEVFIHPKCFAFARFSLLEDARRALEMMDGLEDLGLLFSCCPANEKMPRGTVKPVVKDISTGASKKSSRNNKGTSRSNSVKHLLIRTELEKPVIRTKLEKLVVRTELEKPVMSRIPKSCDKANGLYSDHHVQATTSCANTNGILSTPDILHHSGSISDISDEEWDHELLNHPQRYMDHSPMVTFMGLVGGDDNQRIELSGVHTANEWGLTPVRVSEVNSPDRIWIQLAEYPEHDLEALSVAMTTSDPNTVSRGELMVGLYCAVLVSVGGTQEREEDGFYRRARVTEVNRPHYIGQPQATLELIDCGSTMHSVSLRNLYKLPHGLRVGVIPPLALPTAIDGLYSTFNHGEKWFPLDKQLLWKHLRHKMVFAKVTRKPSGLQVGVVDLYYDRVGKNRVTNLLLTKGVYLSSTSLLAETTPIPQTIPSQAVTTPPRSLLSRLSYLLKKSENKTILSSYDPQNRNYLCTKETSSMSAAPAPRIIQVSNCEKGDCKEAAIAGIKMPPLERASLSGEDSWSNESDECCHSDPRRLSSKSLVLTSGYHSRTECLTDDDW